MSDELSAMFRAAAGEESAAAEREFPYSAATLGRFVGDVRRRRVAGGAMLAIAGVAVVGVVALGLDQLRQAPSPAVPPVASTSSSPSTNSSAAPRPTVAPSASSTPSSTSTPTPSAPEPSAPKETTPAPDSTAPQPPLATTAVAVPGQVTVIDAGEGGGSGEIMAFWDGVADATGYRVYRSASAGGPFDRSASYDVATGETTVEANVGYEYIDIWSYEPQHFQYVEVTTSDPTYFRVTAFNAAGEGPSSVVVCGRPIGFPAC